MDNGGVTINKIDFKLNGKIEFVFDEGGPGVSLIQDVQDDYILITIPMKGINIKILCKDEEIDGFYYDGNNVYMFTSKVLDRIVDNIPLYKISIPNSFKKVQRRDFVRIPISIPIIYTNYNDELKDMEMSKRVEEIEKYYNSKWKKGYTWDLSGGGAKVNLYKPLRTDNIIYLILKHENLYIGVKGRVVRCIPYLFKKQISYHIGLEFVEISEGKRDKIIRFIFAKLREMQNKDL